MSEVEVSGIVNVERCNELEIERGGMVEGRRAERALYIPRGSKRW